MKRKLAGWLLVGLPILIFLGIWAYGIGGVDGLYVVFMALFILSVALLMLFSIVRGVELLGGK